MWSEVTMRMSPAFSLSGGKCSSYLLCVPGKQSKPLGVTWGLMRLLLRGWWGPGCFFKYRFVSSRYWNTPFVCIRTILSHSVLGIVKMEYLCLVFYFVLFCLFFLFIYIFIPWMPPYILVIPPRHSPYHLLLWTDGAAIGIPLSWHIKFLQSGAHLPLRSDKAVLLVNGIPQPG